MDAPASLRDARSRAVGFRPVLGGRHRPGTVNRWVTMVLLIVIVFFAIAAPALVVATNQRQANRTQLAVVCTSARANIDQLTALQEVADRLGIPHDFNVPEVPPECAGF